ncbi:MAG: LysM peptidoglycan-binding domain-containing protein [Bacteroidetes bacterium]|nr:LysM peptidoglycan-binding domain-containing protein [Bacteroidota bacterium]
MRAILTVILSLFLLGQVSAQQKVIKNDEACYIHLVEKGNTLYGISKQYAVGIPDLFRVNPDARLGITVGQELYIPIASIDRKEARNSPELEGSILFHEVKKGETLYSLGKTYKVDINDILEANLNIIDGTLSKGQRVRIPTSKVQEEEALVEPAVRDSLILHEVLPGETLYGITKLYNITEDSLRNVNGGLPQGLKAGSTIRIPRYRDDFSSSSHPKGSMSAMSLGRPESRPMKEVTAAFLLPFSLTGSDSSLFRGKSELMRMTDIAFEFYRGARYALDELEDEGLRARVIVMDVGSGQQDIDKAILSLEKEKVDIVIGPMHRGAFKLISENQRMNGVHFVSPVSKNLDISQNSTSVSKVNASSEVQMGHLARFVKESYGQDNIVVISNAKRSQFEEFKKAWMVQDSLGNYTFQGKTFSTLEWSRGMETSLQNALSPDKENVIVFPCAERSVVTEFMSKLAMTSFKKFNITLIGLEEWLTYDNLDMELLNTMNLTVCVNKFIDSNSQNFMDFMQHYYASYNTIPSKDGYAFQAYDITKYYIGGLLDHGRPFIDHQDRWTEEGILLGFKMRSRGDGSFENMYSLIIQNQDQEFKVLDKE